MSNKLIDKYPHIPFRKNWKLKQSSLLLLGQCEAYIDAIKRTPILPNYYQKLRQLSLRKGVQATTAIEGNTLTEEEIQAIIDGKKLQPSKQYQAKEIENMVNAFNKLFRQVVYDKEINIITEKLLCDFHKMIGDGLGEFFPAIPGQFRNRNVTVGTYRCPDYTDVKMLVENFCQWMHEEFHFGDKNRSFLDVIIQAIVSHLYVEIIHPFGDGNGRTGRLIEFYILLRGGLPDVASHILSNHYNDTRVEYYHYLKSATQKRDLTDFIEYAIVGLRDGLSQTLKRIQKGQSEITWKKMIYDKFDEINGKYKKNTTDRLKKLILELDMNSEIIPSNIPKIVIKSAKFYNDASLKTIKADIKRLIDLQLIKEIENKLYPNTDILSVMFSQQIAE